MRSLWVPILIVLASTAACRRPAPEPIPAARVVVRFLDRDAVLVLPTPPQAGTWRYMNAGQWEPLDLRWKPGTPPIGATVVGRTAPDWVMIEDPSGETHRVVMRGPGPEDLARRNERLEPDEMDALAVLGLLWALAWSRH